MQAEFHSDNLSQANLFSPVWLVIYEKLFNDIIHFILPPGTLLKETNLAKQFNTSRTPVKTVLEKLLEDGLLKKEGRAYAVTNVSSEDCFLLLEARLALEPQAAVLAAKRITTAQLEEMAKLLAAMKKMEETGDTTAFPAVDHQFHKIVIDAAGNHVISELYQHISPKILRYRFCNADLGQKLGRPVTKNLYATHLAIYQALKNRFSETAAQELASDIRAMQMVANLFDLYGQSRQA